MALTDLPITIGICAYNEAQIIERSIRSVYSQKLDGIVIDEVIVVSSGSTDGTDDIVKNLMSEYPNLRLIRQEKREGKNSAINCYLDSKKTEIVVMLNADNAFGTDESLQKLVEPLRADDVGITGGHPVPTNDPKDKVGFAVCLMWAMHHELAMIHPKIGELIAFKDIGTRLRTDMQSDEDMLRMKIEEAGMKCVYVGDSIILNRGPETLDDFIKQRVRVNVGECVMKKNFDYDIPTWNKKYLLKAMFASRKVVGFHPFKMLWVARLEMKCRKQAQEIADRGGDMPVWEQVKSTKKL